jgi:hypothetical protein
LFLLGVIVDDGDKDNDNDGNNDTGTFLEAVCPSVLNYTKSGRNHGGDAKHSEDEVLKDLADHIAHSTDLPLMTFVCSKTENIIRKIRTNL